MTSELRQTMRLGDMAPVRTAIADMVTKVSQGGAQDTAMARIQAAMDMLIENIDESATQHELAAPAPAAQSPDDFRAVGERLEGEIASGAQALDTLQQAFSGLMRVEASPAERDIHERPGMDDAILPEASPSLVEHDQRQVRLWQSAFEASADGIVITDAQERILLVNPAVTTITGYAPEDLLGRTPRLFRSGRHDREFYRGMWEQLMTDGHWHGEIWDKRKNGDIYPKWLSINAVSDQRGRVTHYVSLFSDMTERKNQEEQIQFLAYHDPLTGLPNRRLLQDHFEREAAHARRHGLKLHLLFLDLDHFKSINDDYGHAVGDRFLQAIVARLKSCLRVTDIISRLGGDEFVIVLSEMHGVVDLPHILRKLLAGLEEPFEIEGNRIKASTSIGIGIFPDDGADFGALLHKADTAMYQAKRQNRGGYLYFDDNMNAAAQERRVLERHLLNALDQGEIRLHYQPQTRLRMRRVAGVEAFPQWENPLLGAVDPGRFGALVEESGLTWRIGEWMLREACRQIKAWHAAGWTHLTVSLKLAPAMFAGGDLPDILARVLADTGVDAGCLELGFAEASMADGQGAVMETAKHLKSLGIRLFLDGFGGGCISLDCLQRAAVDRIKIARSLVAGLPGNHDSAAIVRAIAQMANCLDLTVIADGVVSETQVAFLRAAGCELGQGPLFGEPQANPSPALWN